MKGKNHSIDTSVSVDRIREALADMIRNNRLDFLAYVNTKWQVMGVNAKMNEYEGDKNGLILIPEYQLGNRISPDDFQNVSNNKLDFWLVTGFKDRNFSKIATDYSKRLYSYHTLFRKDKDEYEYIDIITKQQWIDFFNPLFSRKEMVGYCPRYITVDTGVGDYIHSRPKQQILKRSYNIIEQKLRKRAINNLPSEQRQLFSVKDGRMVLRKEIRNAYQEVVDQPSGASQESVLLVTQPGDIFHPDGHDFVKRIYIRVKELGYPLTIKPHPEENSSKYNGIISDCEDIRVAENDVPVEEYVVENNPKFVVGFNSTSLLTLKVLYDIETYTIIDHYLDECNNSTKEKRLVKFRHMTSNYIHSFREI